jgi:hypothetical protein
VDYVIANPPFNVSDYSINTAETHKWKYGFPPQGNANYAWLQHFVSKLAPYGAAGIVRANGSMSSETATEGDIRKAMIEADLVDCMVALPSQLFYNTQIPACLWFLSRNKTETRSENFPTRLVSGAELTETVAENFPARLVSGAELTETTYKDISSFSNLPILKRFTKTSIFSNPAGILTLRKWRMTGLYLPKK